MLKTKSSPAGAMVVLAALQPELNPLRKALAGMAGVRLVSTGVGPSRAYQSARKALNGARLVVSTGCCGGLVPGAEAGLLVVPSVLLLRNGSRAEPAPAPEPHWSAQARRIADQLGLHCTDRPLITVSAALYTPEAKRLCHEQTGAVAVDMETAAVARAAHEAGVPHLVLRVVLDAAHETLPEARVSGDDGRIRPLLLLRAAARGPRSFLSLAAMGLRLRGITASLGTLLAALLQEDF